MNIAVVTLALALGIAGRVSHAREEPRFIVIVHPKNDVSSVSRSFLRDAYLKKSTEWSSGDSIRPVDLAMKFPTRVKFTEDVLKKTPSQLKNYWSQQIFSGKGVPPPEASSSQSLINYVLANPGAVGYLPADVDPGGAKVVTVN